MPAPASPDAIRDVNTRYHDAAAEEYDAKWGIDFGDIGAQQVLGKIRKALGDLPRFERALEIGAGTGYFSLNLLKAGVVGHATCSDISPGMMATCKANGERLGLADRLETVVTDAERLPFADESFDLVLGHAVLHHLPDLDQAFREFERVLRPGGVVVFAGEPSRQGDKIAAYPKRAAMKLSPLWRKAMRAQAAPHVEQEHQHDHDGVQYGTGVQPHQNGHNGHHHHEPDGHALEPFVDVHAFVPGDLEGFAQRAGFTEVKVRGEELLANWFGWANRTLESTAVPETVPWGWRQYAFRGYIALQKVDRALLEGRLPAGVFYNLIISARKAG
jgi:ubiquinone/menaquinone biosynthesis C-methylase UbiE